MIKREELSNPESCMSRALPHERTFVLLARDGAAPIAIRGWIMARVARGKNTMDDPQIIEVLQCAEFMEAERAGIKATLSAALLSDVMLADMPKPPEAPAQANHASDCPHWANEKCTCETAKESR